MLIERATALVRRYPECFWFRHPDAAFDQLQLELSLEINEAMTQTRRKLLENFDDEVREKLKVRDEVSKAFLSQLERRLMQLSQHELDGHAEFLDDSPLPPEFQPVPLRKWEDSAWIIRTPAPFR